MNGRVSLIRWPQAARPRRLRMRRIAALVLAWWSLSVLGAALLPCVEAIAGQSSVVHANHEQQQSHGNPSVETQALKYEHLHAMRGTIAGHDSQPVGDSHCPDFLDLPIVAAEAKLAPARDGGSGMAVIVQVADIRLQGRLPVHSHSARSYRATVHPPDILRRTSRLLI